MYIKLWKSRTAFYKLSPVNENQKDFDLAVLGAGVVGVNTAYWAQQAGLSVAVIDRQPAAGLETSFANGGQIAVSHAEPWANPQAPLQVLKWLFDSSAPLLFRPRMDWAQWRWIVAFLTNCTANKADVNTASIVRLAMESRERLREIRERENIEYDHRTEGILHFYRDHRSLDSALHAVGVMRKHGCKIDIIQPDRVVELEPAFAARKSRIIGATYCPHDESGDAFKFTQALARICASRGAEFWFGSEAVALHKDKNGKRISGVETRTPQGYKTLRARDVVVCLGSYSAPFLKRYGIRLNLYPAKGYSITIPTDPSSHTCPLKSLTDDEYKLVYSNLGDRLRVAGTAELSGYSIHLDHQRCRTIVDNVRGLFPDAGRFEEVQYWAGLRPTTPTNVPYIQGTGYGNLWINTGHGTLGWTLGPGSGKRIVEMINKA